MALFSPATAATTRDQPNIIIIYGDDVGYGDVGVDGSELIPTPNIDALAAGGYASPMAMQQQQPLVAPRDSPCSQANGAILIAR